VSGKGAKQRIFVEVGQRFGKLVVQSTDARVGCTESKPFGWRAAVCLCDCGETVTVALSNLVSGRNKSCGCLKKGDGRWSDRERRLSRRRAAWRESQAGKEPKPMYAKTEAGRKFAAGMRARQTPEQAARREANRKPPPVNYVHGLAVNPLYRLHKAMMRRCYDADWPGYKHWGGRGIRVHEPWHDVRVFIADIESTIGPRPEGKYSSGMPLYTIDRVDNESGYRPGNLRWATMAEQMANRRKRHKLPRHPQCPWDTPSVPSIHARRFPAPMAANRSPAGSSHSGVPCRNFTANPPPVHPAGDPAPSHATDPLTSPAVSGVTDSTAEYTAPVDPAAMFCTVTVAPAPR